MSLCAVPDIWRSIRSRLAMPEPLLDAVDGELRHLAEGHTKDLSGLDRTVREFARASRATGRLPERMLVMLVAVLHGPATDGMGQWWRAVLRDRCVREAIEAYYAIELTAPIEGPTAGK